MAQITNYTCDKCGRLDTKPAFVVPVSVYIDGHRSAYSHISASLKADFCQPCLEDMGLKASKFQPQEVRENPSPTIETLLREIIREEMVGNTG